MAVVNYQVTVNLNITDDVFERNVGPLTFATSASARDSRLISVGTSEESITIAGDITSGNGPGWLFLLNKDGTNYVEVGFATTVFVIRLNAGFPALLPLNVGETDIFFKANTAACDVEIIILER